MQSPQKLHISYRLPHLFGIQRNSWQTSTEGGSNKKVTTILLDWHVPTITDFDAAQTAAAVSHSLANDEAFSNIFLYSKKLGIQVAFYDGCLFRLYEPHPGDFFYAPPLGIDYADDSEQNARHLAHALALLKADADAKQRRFKLILLTDDKKRLFELAAPRRFAYTENRDFADYLYRTPLMASLAGKKLQKKRNHVSHFMKTHTDIHFEPLTEQNAKDAQYVEEQWFAENSGESSFDKIIEREMIQTALQNRELLNLTGGVLYADGVPAAMTVGSRISPAAFDINFEKSYAPFDKDGAYTVVFNEFAKLLTEYEFINREEDLGIEGLRKSKLSYQPALLLTKWQALENINTER